MTGLPFLGFGSPLWGLAVAPAVLGLVALYTVRTQPRHRVLASTRIWEAVLARKRPNSFLSRYRHSLFFLLQLLVLLLIGAALLRPRLRSDTSGDVIVVVDVSASMAALDGRMDAARDKAKELIDALDDTARGMVVAAGPALVPLGDWSQDKGELRARVGDLAPLPGGARPSGELLSLLARLKTADTGIIHLVTDGMGPEDLAGGVPGARIMLHPVGETRDNVGITRLDVRPDRGGYQVAALVRNFSSLAAEVEVELLAGTPSTQRETVPPGGRERLVLFHDAVPKDGVLGARVRVTGSKPGTLATDRLASDDTAWAAPRRGAVRALVISPKGEDLERALKLTSAVEVTRIEPAAFPAFRPKLDAFDLVVSDGFTGDGIEERPLLLFHGEGVSRFSTGRNMSDPSMVGSDSTHPLMRFLAIREVGIDGARVLDRFEGAKSVLQAAEGPLIAVHEGTAARKVITAFSLAETDLARRVAFPILLTNAVRWLLEDDSKLKGQFRVHQPVRLPGDRRAVVTPPEGPPRIHEASGPGPRILDEFRSLGVWRIQLPPDVAVPYPVNLLDPAESDLAPRATATVEVGESGTTGPGSGTESPWRLLLLAAGVVMLVEWLLLATRGGAS